MHTSMLDSELRKASAEYTESLSRLCTPGCATIRQPGTKARNEYIIVVSEPIISNVSLK